MKKDNFNSRAFANLIKIQDLRMIIALSKQRTILRAAEEMGLSQPAITKRLQDLEKELGVSLFHRMSRGVEPTPYGDILIKHAHIILNQIRHAEGEVSDLSDGSGGRISVGVPVAAATDLISQSITRLLESRQNVQVTLMEGYNIKLIPALKRGDIDLIVGRLPRKDLHDDVAQEFLYREGFKVIVRNEHPLAKKANVTAKDLSSCNWMMPLQDSIMYSQIKAYFKRESQPMPQASVFSLSYVASLKVLKSKDLVCIFPYESIRTEIEAGEVTALDVDVSFNYSEVGIVTRQNGFLSPAAQMFIEILREEGRLLAD